MELRLIEENYFFIASAFSIAAGADTEAELCIIVPVAATGAAGADITEEETGAGVGAGVTSFFIMSGLVQAAKRREAPRTARVFLDMERRGKEEIK